ncbi:MAG: DNA polymerase [Alphaproteobacteria bacterium]
MNIKCADDQVQWLFLDLNSFFASCEQQDRAELRGKPVIVVPMMNDATCAIAASYAAKAFGIRTGTRVWEAKKMCPDLLVIKARHKLYVDYHHRILEVLDSCIPISKVMSIDEAACRLMGSECHVEKAIALSHKIKTTLREKIGEAMTCSIGLGPNIFLSKIASGMKKPDGLTIIRKCDLPQALHPLKLQQLYGVGRRMEERLIRHGIKSVATLMAASPYQLRRVWGGVQGALYYELLHGADLQPPSSAFMHSISHQHVLEPEFRNQAGARQFAQHLLTKATERLRYKGYYCRRLGISLRLEGEPSRYWWNETTFAETQDTGFLMQQMMRLCINLPSFKPKKITVLLLDLVHTSKHQPDLFATQPERKNLLPLIDKINHRYGRNTISFGRVGDGVRSFTGHAAFQRVPERFEF